MVRSECGSDASSMNAFALRGSKGAGGHAVVLAKERQVSSDSLEAARFSKLSIVSSGLRESCKVARRFSQSSRIDT